MTFPEWIHFAVTEAVRFVSPIGLAAEWMFTGLAGLLVLIIPLSLAPAFSLISRPFRWLAARPRLAASACILLPVLIRLASLPVNQVPIPSIHDEFSHMLLADTLAHGRLTNPTPVMWRHFESIHIIQRPTYNSMYPPGQGMFLAFGEVLFHQQWAGVELALAMMCGAMYWMFIGFIPRTWALFGVMLAAQKLALFGIWTNSYISAAVPSIGGALVVGAFPRLREDASNLVNTIFLGLGAVLLMYTRPLEGGVLTVAVLTLTAPSCCRQFIAAPSKVLKRFVLPASAILLAGVAFLGFYSYRVTGQATRLPYEVNRATYGWPENLALLPPKSLNVEDPVLHRMYELEVSHHDIYKSMPALLDNLLTRLFDNWAFFIGPLLTIPLLFGMFTASRSARTLVLLLVLLLILNMAQLLLYPYHLSPVVPVMFCLIAIGCQSVSQRLGCLSKGRGQFLLAILPLFLFLITGLKMFGDTVDIPASSYWERGYEWHREARADIVRWLNLRSGKHLVIVRYSPEHPVNQEWVYNGADLDNSKIIWARAVGPEADADLLQYYNDRQPWIVDADAVPQHVVPYDSSCLPCALSPVKRRSQSLPPL